MTLWEKDFGGNSSDDDMGNISQTIDGGYLIAGTSYSNIGGDKTENNLGIEQTWLIKTDSLGGKEWDKTIFTNGHDEAGYALQSNDNCYTVANYSDAGIGGYKTQINWGGSDYWIIKLCDSTFTTGVALEQNENEIKNFPSPSSEMFTVSGLQIMVGAYLKVFDVLGREIYSQFINTPNYKLRTADWIAGIYFVQIILEKKRWVGKFVKQ